MLLAASCAALPSRGEDKHAAGQDEWQTHGLIRVRDLTPFGLARLDFTPAHAVDAPAGTWAVEANLAYQNTYLVSDPVAALLAARGPRRAALTAADAAAIVALPGDAVLVDGELALLDLTLHYAIRDEISLYVSLPTYTFQGGFLDSSIEGFHDEFGFSSADRDLVRRDQFQVVYAVGGDPFVALEPPNDYQLGDPVAGVRWLLPLHTPGWRAVVEAAIKPAWHSGQSIVSTGETDFGFQATLQRRLRRSAWYFSYSLVAFAGAEHLPGVEDDVVPTTIVGWERRVTRFTNFVVQMAVSPSVIQNTTLNELTDDKYQLSFGLLSRRGRHGWRFALTENVSHFENTPDLGFSFGYAHLARPQVARPHP